MPITYPCCFFVVIISKYYSNQKLNKTTEIKKKEKKRKTPVEYQTPIANFSTQDYASNSSLHFDLWKEVGEGGGGKRPVGQTAGPVWLFSLVLPWILTCTIYQFKANLWFAGLLKVLTQRGAPKEKIKIKRGLNFNDCFRGTHGRMKD